MLRVGAGATAAVGCGGCGEAAGWARGASVVVTVAGGGARDLEAGSGLGL